MLATVPDLSGYNVGGLSLTTTDGQIIQVSDQSDLLDMMGGEGFENPWQLKIGQPTEDISELMPYEGNVGRGGDREPKFYLERYTSDGDGTKERILIGSSVQAQNNPNDTSKLIKVYPLTSRMDRIFWGTKFNSASKSDPDCASHDFNQRDARYTGPIPYSGKHRPDVNNGADFEPPACAMVDEKGKLKESCKLAQFQHIDGKNVKPPCTAQYILYCAVSCPDNEVRLAYAVFKSTSAGEGFRLLKQLRDTAKQGKAYWTNPVALIPFGVGKGNNFKPLLITKEQTPEDDDTQSGLLEMEKRAIDNREYEMKKATYIPEKKDESGAAPDDEGPEVGWDGPDENGTPVIDVTAKGVDFSKRVKQEAAAPADEPTQTPDKGNRRKINTKIPY
jgi:hypothetical protein